jgi:hypothetical protein
MILGQGTGTVNGYAQYCIPVVYALHVPWYVCLVLFCQEKGMEFSGLGLRLPRTVTMIRDPWDSKIQHPLNTSSLDTDTFVLEW